MIGRIFACVLRDDLERRALNGDKVALRVLLTALDRDLPASTRNFWRNHQLRSLAEDMLASLPGTSTTRISELMAGIGAAMEAGEQPDPSSFPELDSRTFATVVERISFMQQLDARPWLHERHIRSIIQ